MNTLESKMNPLKTDPLYFIVNPEAQNRKSLKLWKKIEQQLISQNINYQVFYTEKKDHAQQLTQNILKKSTERTHIIAVGGDGTLHEVVNGAARFSNALISCIPAGSGNDFARGIQKTRFVSDALSLFGTHKEGAQAVDIGEFMTANRSGYFINSLGMGMDAEITYEVNQSQWKRWFNLFKAGQLIYMYTFLKRLFTYKRSDMDVILDNQAHHFKKVWFIVVANQPYFGGGIKIAPDARFDDEEFNILVVHTISPIKLLSVFIKVYWGGHLRIKNVDSFSAHGVQITSKQPVKIQADGEFIGVSHVEVKMSAEKISVLSKVNN